MKKLLLLSFASFFFSVKSYSQTLIAGWDFQTTTNGGTAVAASPNTPTAYVANVGSGNLYLDGTNNSSSWLQASELNSFAGTSLNAGGGTGLSTVTTSPASLAILGGVGGTAANGKFMVFKFSMTGYTNLILSYATQKTSTGFATQTWEYSTNGTVWSSVGAVTSVPTSFAIQTLPTVTGLDNAATAYLRLTVTGASNATGNNRIDNIQLNATGAVAPTNYYSNGSGDLDAEATWNTNTAGTGGTALSVGGFTAGNVILNMRNGNPGNINAATWTVSGTNSKVVVDGTDLTIPSTKTIVAIVDVNAGRTVRVQTSTLPTFGTLGAGSTIEFNQSTAFSIPTTVNYSNLKLSGAGTKTFGGNTTTITGNLILDGQSDGTLTIDAPSANPFATISLGGDLTYLGTVINPVDANSITLSSTSATTQTITANGNTVRFFRIASGSSGNNIILSTIGGSSNALLGNASSGGLTLNLGTTFDINGNTVTFFAGGATMLPNTNAGLLKGSSTSSIVINKTTVGFWGNLYFAAGFENLKDLTINHTGASAATVSVGTSFNLYGTLTMTAGQLTLADKNITLISNASGTARVAASAVASPFLYSTGKFILQRYIPGGKRAFRFLGNPFNTAIDLSSLTDNIIITGGPGTGFTPSTSNNASAFWYNTATGNENASNDIGWTAFTTTDGTGVGTENLWKQYQGIRVLVRGNIADGLSPVTPSAVTIDAGGVLNSGTQTINVNKGVNSGFNFISNPFASSIDLDTTGGRVTIGSNLVNNYYVWDLSLATKGGWDNRSFNTSYILPSFAGFIVKTAALDAVTITENAKTASAATGTLYRNNKPSVEMVRLWVKGNNINWDKFELQYNNGAKTTEDKYDGSKLLNSEVNLYSIQNNKNYSIDARPFVKDDIIPLGFTSTVQQSYTIKANDYSLPANVELYLRDKFLGTETKLEEGTEYTFSVNSNTASQGNERFELVQKQIAALPILTASTFSVKLSPNPAADMVKVSFSNEEKINTVIVLTNAEGKTIKTVNAGEVQDGQISINVKGLTKGTYYVTLNNGKERKTEKLVIQ